VAGSQSLLNRGLFPTFLADGTEVPSGRNPFLIEVSFLLVSPREMGRQLQESQSLLNRGLFPTLIDKDDSVRFFSVAIPS